MMEGQGKCQRTKDADYLSLPEQWATLGESYSPLMQNYVCCCPEVELSLPPLSSREPVTTIFTYTRRYASHLSTDEQEGVWCAPNMTREEDQH